SIFALFYGYESMYHKEYLKFLSSLRSHRKTFAAIVISRSILFIAAFLFLFLCVLLFLAVSGIGFFTANYATLTGFLVSKLGMLLFFFMVGVFFGTFRSVLFSAISMFTAWFFLVFIIPGLINAAVEKKIPDITKDYQTELSKYAKLVDFENKTEKKMGKFNRGNIEAERQNIEEFKKVDYKEMENLEKALRDEIAAAIHTYYTLSAWTPVTFYQCTGNEVSSRGYASFLDFYKYAIDLKREFVWFFIQRVFYNDPKVMVSFIKKDENIYRASSQLPPNFARGLLINFLFIILLFMISLFRCENALFPLPEKANAYDDLELDLETGNQYTYNVYYPEAIHQLINAFFSGGKRLNWKIALDDQNILTQKMKKGDFLYLPNGDTLPGDLKAGHLLCLFKRLLKLSREEIEKAREELGKEVLNKRLSAVEPVDRARLLLTLAEMAKGKVRVFLFNDFILGIPVLLREGLSERGERLKADGVLVMDMISTANAWLDADIVSSIVLKDGKYKVI
ncbi:MAG: hypothetical protein GTN82_04420, partial [Candidatus Aminicenantes bacterium]|nr:hypothetical protein [Candidatus Aminicenantes bacterium]NIN17256.1 hypothetical protein [Candidatus Aminicenantes bacterium]NIQ65812.1 hypothetical protein [Candidatus Aminicenantes bacterium]NIR04648.1 hypothetical protein [Candidatus Aminicenantes bacterium]